MGEEGGSNPEKKKKHTTLITENDDTLNILVLSLQNMQEDLVTVGQK